MNDKRVWGEIIRRELERTSADGHGLWAWLTSTNHKTIATRYIVTAFVFFLLGGIEASIWPLMLALATAVAFVIGIFTPWAFPVAAALAFASLAGWFFSNPNSDNRRVKLERTRPLAGHKTVAQASEGQA